MLSGWITYMVEGTLLGMTISTAIFKKMDKEFGYDTTDTMADEPKEMFDDFNDLFNDNGFGF